MTRIAVLRFSHNKRQIRSRIEYVIPNDSIIVPDWHFNFTL